MLRDAPSDGISWDNWRTVKVGIKTVTDSNILELLTSAVKSGPTRGGWFHVAATPEQKEILKISSATASNAESAQKEVAKALLASA